MRITPRRKPAFPTHSHRGVASHHLGLLCELQKIRWDEVQINKHWGWPHWAWMRNQLDFVRGNCPQTGEHFTITEPNWSWQRCWVLNASSEAISKWVRESLEKLNGAKVRPALAFLISQHLESLYREMKCMFSKDDKLGFCFLQKHLKLLANFSQNKFTVTTPEYNFHWHISGIGGAIPILALPWPQSVLLTDHTVFGFLSLSSLRILLNTDFWVNLPRVVRKKYQLLAMPRIEKWAIDL